MYRGLTVEAILEFGRQTESVGLHLPDERDVQRLPRQWIVNVIYSLVGEPFRQWIS